MLPLAFAVVVQESLVNFLIYRWNAVVANDVGVVVVVVIIVITWLRTYITSVSAIGMSHCVYLLAVFFIPVLSLAMLWKIVGLMGI